jgi:colanic acid/amylovoran biosynthesis glycosyltransferase
MAVTIGHIVPTYLPRSETFTHDLIRAMPGFHHRVFTTRVENLDQFPFPGLEALASEEDYPDAVARHDVRLLLCHFGPSGLAALPAGLVHGIPVVTIFHGYDVTMLLRDPRWVARYQALFRFGAHAICISDAGRAALVSIGCPPVDVTAIHLGVDVDRFAFQPRHPGAGQPLRLLMVARLTAKKGIDVALLALRRRLDAGARDTLRIIGAGEQHEALLALRRTLRLEEAVTFPGPASRDGVRLAMAQSDALLQPSTTAPDGDAEGIPVALMEAMASGLPVIATRHAGIPELVEDEVSGLLVAERDPEGLAEAMGRLAESPGVARRLAARARQTVETRFNLRTQAGHFAALLRRIVAQGARVAPARATRPEAGGGALFIRSSPVSQSLAHLVALADRHPGVPITVLTTADTGELFERCPLVARVLRYTAPRLSLGGVEPQTIAAIKAADFGPIYVSAATGDGSGYANVEAFARACGHPVVVMLPSLEERRAGVPREECPA